MSDDTSKDETVITSTIGETEMKQFFSAFLAVMILAGCANTMPLIDMKSSGNPAEAQEDWIHCERLADLAERDLMTASRIRTEGSAARPKLKALRSATSAIVSFGLLHNRQDRDRFIKKAKRGNGPTSAKMTFTPSTLTRSTLLPFSKTCHVRLKS